MRNPNYKLWLDTVINVDGAGALYWILSGLQDDGSLYPDYDGFTVYCPSPVCTTIGNFGTEIAGNGRTFDPVADHDGATTPFNTPVALNVTANDIAYRTGISPRTLDLDPTAGGQQKTRSVAGGTFTADEDGNVTFTPTAGFVGRASVSYVVGDRIKRTSNQATITINVLPDPTAAIKLFSFETGTEGWGPGGGTGTLSQSSAFATDGTSSLQINVTGEGWFGAVLPAAVEPDGQVEDQPRPADGGGADLPQVLDPGR